MYYNRKVNNNSLTPFKFHSAEKCLLQFTGESARKTRCIILCHIYRLRFVCKMYWNFRSDAPENCSAIYTDNGGGSRPRCSVHRPLSCQQRSKGKLCISKSLHMQPRGCVVKHSRLSLVLR